MLPIVDFIKSKQLKKYVAYGRIICDVHCQQLGGFVDWSQILQADEAILNTMMLPTDYLVIHTTKDQNGVVVRAGELKNWIITYSSIQFEDVYGNKVKVDF